MKKVWLKDALIIFMVGLIGLVIGIVGTFKIVNNILLDHGLEIQFILGK